MNRSLEELAGALAAIDTGEVASLLTPSADFAQLAQQCGYPVSEAMAGLETLYEIRPTSGVRS
jgi:hypothetical protein